MSVGLNPLLLVVPQLCKMGDFARSIDHVIIIGCYEILSDNYLNERNS